MVLSGVVVSVAVVSVLYFCCRYVRCGAFCCCGLRGSTCGVVVLSVAVFSIVVLLLL